MVGELVSGEAAVEDQPGEPLRVPGGVLDRHRPALRHRQQGEAVEPGVVGDRLEIGDPGLEAVVGHPAVRQPVTPLVVADHGRDPAELDQVVPPDRALPVELQVAQPARVDQQRRAGAVDGVRDPDAVGRPGEADVLHRVRVARRHATILEAANHRGTSSAWLGGDGRPRMSTSPPDRTLDIVLPDHAANADDALLPLRRRHDPDSRTSHRAETPQVSGIDRYFGIIAQGSTIPREVRAGFTTWLTMSYILFRRYRPS